MSSDITIRRLDAPHVVRAGGAILGETSQALEVSELGHPSVIYFPREDVAMAFLDPSDKETSCPKKGVARYFSIVTKSKTLSDVVWSYETPLESIKEIAGHLAFADVEEVTVETL